jgi:glycosyltransferase involved in cell wall biosynthesis
MPYYLIGPYPPPLGGISVFIYRYAKILKSSGEDLRVLDFSKNRIFYRISWLLRLITDPKPGVFHANGFDFFVFLALWLRPFRGKYIFQDHSGRFIESLSGYQRFIFSHYLAKVDELILVGHHLKKYYSQAGFPLPKSVKIQNAFLPPPIEDESKIWDSYSPDTILFIQEHSPLIIANAYKIVFYEGIDLYGLDLCVALVAALRDGYPKLGMLFALAEIGDIDYFNQVNKWISENHLNDNFFFLLGQKELWPIFQKAQVMVRPTFVDGFGISISEALHFGCPAVASNVCERATGTILFRNRDINDLIEKVKTVLDETSW